jgi:hypothetical protein
MKQLVEVDSEKSNYRSYDDVRMAKGQRTTKCLGIAVVSPLEA